MKIVGCDLHTRHQQVAMLDEETGEWVERRLEHESGEAAGPPPRPGIAPSIEVDGWPAHPSRSQV